MGKRFVAIWFRHLTTDWWVRRQPALRGQPFVLAAPERGRMVIRAVSAAAHAKGIFPGMVVADGRALFPSLQVLDDRPGQNEKLLHALAEWCLRYTPVAAADPPEGLILDASGCAHLWGGEGPYLQDITGRLQALGYEVRAAIADTPGAAWAVSRYGRQTPFVPTGGQAAALLSLPPAALRLEPEMLQRMEKLGLKQIEQFIRMPRGALRRRFGSALLTRLDQALGQEEEPLQPVQPVQPYQERLPSLEPIRTNTGIGIGLRRLLDTLCERLAKEAKGLRNAVFRAWRVDGQVQQIAIGTNRPSRNAAHLFKLFEEKIGDLEPGLGFELFMLEASLVEDLDAAQDTLWHITTGKDERVVAELLDRLGGKLGMQTIRRYLPAEHYWPERSVREAASLQEQPQTGWPVHLPRPVHLLPEPEPIEVTVPIPDYPPMLFRYQGKLHQVSRADGPERIEREWWLEQGEPRDYYCVEDEAGGRYWLFRLGHYHNGAPQWFIHGFFA